jgi:hypothetical protein
MVICNIYGDPIVFDKDLLSKLDMSYLGNIEMGKMSIYDLKMLFRTGFEKKIEDTNEWLEEYLGHCLTKNDDTKAKFNEMKNNIYGKYNMRFHITVELEVIGAFTHRTSCQIINYGTNLWIDNVLMIENEVDYGWQFEELMYYPIMKRDFWSDIEGKDCYEDCYESKYLLYEIKTFMLKKKQMGIINEELIQKAMSPKRLARHLELGGDIEDF